MFALGYLWIRRRHKPIKFLIPEIFFRPGSPRPFISSELLAHLGDSGRLRSPIKSAKKSLCRDDLLHLSGSPHAGRLLTSTQTAGATPTHTDSEPPCCISPFHVCHAHHGTSAGTTSSSHGFFLRSAHWVTQHSSSLRSLVDGKSPSSGRKKPFS